MRRILFSIAVATIGFGLSTSRGDEKPATRPTPSDRIHEQQAELESRINEILKKRTLEPQTHPSTADRLAEIRRRNEEVARLNEEVQRRNEDVKQQNEEVERQIEEVRKQLKRNEALFGPGHPATQPSEDVLAEFQRRRDAIRERLERDRNNLGPRRPSTQPFVVEPWMPTDMPPGSSPREFNGFTYYIVPLGK